MAIPALILTTSINEREKEMQKLERHYEPCDNDFWHGDEHLGLSDEELARQNVRCSISESDPDEQQDEGPQS